MQNIKITSLADVSSAFENLTPWDQKKFRESIISEEDIKNVINSNPQEYIHLLDDDVILDYVHDNLRSR